MRLPVLALTLALAGCAGTRLPPPPPGADYHAGDQWFEWRARTLGISPEEARRRDASLPDGTDGQVPPEGTLDENTRAEAAILWSRECARCHGEDGVPPPASPGQKQPRSWAGMGPDMGFFFGGDAMRAGIYRTIAEGKGTMAGWGDALSREQIWALVAHIESF